MKQFFTLLFAAFLSTVILAQNPGSPFSSLQKSSQLKNDTVYVTWYLHDSTHVSNYDTTTNSWTISYKTINYYTGRYYHAIENYTADTNNVFLLQSQQFITRDTSNRIIVKTQKFRQNGSLNYYNKDSTVYLGTTNLESEIYTYFYDTVANVWNNASKSVYSYNSNDQLTQRLSYSWNNNQWTNSVKYDYTYDSNGLLIQKKYYTWDGAQWVLNSQVDMTYDANGNLIEHLYSWNSNNTFQPSYKQIFAYNSSNQLINKASYNYQTNINSWVPVDSNVLYYNAGLLVNDTSFYWDNNSSIWMYNTLNSFTYNSNNDPLSYVTQKYDTLQQAWVNLMKFTVTYTLGQPIEKGISPQPATFEGLKSIPDEFKVYQWNNSSWLPLSKNKYFFSSYTEWHISNVETIFANNLEIYPNPATNYIVLDLNNQPTNIQIISMDGHMVKNFRTTENIIQVGDLPHGTYIIRMTQKNKISTGKLIKN